MEKAVALKQMPHHRAGGEPLTEEDAKRSEVWMPAFSRGFAISALTLAGRISKFPSCDL